MRADEFDSRMTSDGTLEMGKPPLDNLDRIDKHGYFGDMKKKFDVGGSNCVYVIQLSPDVWDESVRRGGPKDGLSWIPSFPTDLQDPKVTKSDDWRNLNPEKIRGFLYVGKTQLKGGVGGFKEAISARHDSHVHGGEFQYLGKKGPSPLVSEYGAEKSMLWETDDCLTGLFETEISNKLESWYGWSLGQSGFVVYGPNMHRNLKSPRPGGGKIKPFIGRDPFW